VRFALAFIASLVGASMLTIVAVKVFPFAAILLAQASEEAAGYARSQSMTPSRIENLIDWTKKQRLSRGTVRRVAMPPGFRGFDIGAPLEIARLKDGRYCFLLYTEIGYKENFEGVLSCNAPLLPREIVAASGHYASYISLTGCSPSCTVFEELYIRRARNVHTFDVYFDLN
jgi:hypothetical protein